MSAVADLQREVTGLFAQAVVFTIGLALSLVVGMELAAPTEASLPLVFVTLVAGFALIGAAVVSQMVHDHIVYGREQKA